MSEKKDTEETEKVIFLNDWNVREWERPLKPGFIQIRSYEEFNGHTQLKKFLGLDFVDVISGNYTVFGSAAKYIADIALEDIKKPFRDAKGKPTNPIRERILFSGNLQIYRSGTIPGTNIMGQDYLMEESGGRLWFCVPVLPEFIKLGGLQEAIFANSQNRIEQIEAILKGYKIQEEKERKDRFSREHEAYQRGRGNEREALRGTFGG